MESRLISMEVGGNSPYSGLRPYSVRRIMSRLEALEERVPSNEPLGMSGNVSALGRRLRRLETRFNRLWSMLDANNCTSNPCRNGGECTNIFAGYICKCPDTWTGTDCDEDVNECANYAGTSLGCQNSAVCENTMGGYK